MSVISLTVTFLTLFLMNVCFYKCLFLYKKIESRFRNLSNKKHYVILQKKTPA